MPAASIRARARAEMINEIKAIARRHLAAEGANLSLRAVARDMGMVSSAIYRYFPSRDELLTALIVDGYHALGDAVEAGDAEVTDRADLRGRWLAVCHAVRRWALTQPAEYALLFGSPVPGYAAPQETTVAAARTPAALSRILVDGLAAGILTDPGPAELPGPVHADLAAVRDHLFAGVPEALLARGAAGWIHCFGAVSFELFGQLNGVIEAREEFFDHQMRRMVDLIGLP
ncbi:TetR family transcriptional regulator [Micromonospora craterilacus]|uniref:TetR family transcriptional regulator n=1 Tax=Micromonospora craterilacus TaxID=1655439 RepID=A0A2W2E375_9ACTN|nr:TetR/AcrR family transcriptional regulator [Micromonospora craterilacus]PZG18706.1 TetR family transcriptional regulator [Micromonospora craterilacus]